MQARGWQADLEDQLHEIPTQHVCVFVDEAKPTKDVPWIFLGYLMIPTQRLKGAFNALKSARQVHSYDKELHFQELRNRSSAQYGENTAVARDWLQSFVRDGTRTWHFHLCGINIRRLQRSAFGSGKTEDTIYNRFFRSGLQFGLKTCFDLPIHVDALFHDESHLQEHEYFSWHTIYKFWESQQQITFSDDKIRFICSDHQQPQHPFPKAAQFMQMTDIILGACRQCVAFSSNNAAKIELGEFMLPLMQRITNEREARNWNSSYHHVRRVTAGFFPKVKLTTAQLADEQARSRSGFYVNEPLKLANRLQLDLWQKP